jgi:hypothetical protein
MNSSFALQDTHQSRGIFRRNCRGQFECGNGLRDTYWLNGRILIDLIGYQNGSKVTNGRSSSKRRRPHRVHFCLQRTTLPSDLATNSQRSQPTPSAPAIQAIPEKPPSRNVPATRCLIRLSDTARCGSPIKIWRSRPWRAIGRFSIARGVLRSATVSSRARSIPNWSPLRPPNNGKQMKTYNNGTSGQSMQMPMHTRTSTRDTWPSTRTERYLGQIRADFPEEYHRRGEEDTTQLLDFGGKGGTRTRRNIK